MTRMCDIGVKVWFGVVATMAYVSEIESGGLDSKHRSCSDVNKLFEEAERIYSVDLGRGM